MRHVEKVSSQEARQIAVASQFPQLLGAELTPHNVLGHLGAIQLDAMQRVDKSHRLVCFARIPKMSGRQAVDSYFWSDEGEAAAFEMWAHAVCLVPVQDWPLWKFRRDITRSAAWAPSANSCERIIHIVQDNGPQTIRELESGGKRTSGWNWSETKRATEYLVWTGGLVCCARAGSRRVYDLPERRIPADLLSCEIAKDEAISALALKAARAYGISTASDLTGYFQIPTNVIEDALRESDLIRAEVEGWRETAWIHPLSLNQQAVPDYPTFLSPFDNLIWNRERTRRIFGFDYVLEAYKPAVKRKYGYYVMPLLADGRFSGRADVMRDEKVLRVVKFYPETDSVPDGALSDAVARLAEQLGCDASTDLSEDW